MTLTTPRYKTLPLPSDLSRKLQQSALDKWAQTSAELAARKLRGQS